MNNFDPINDALDIESTPIDSKIEKKKSEKLSKKEEVPDIKRDYEYTRAQLYSLIEKGQEAIDGILEVSQQSDSPRAYEVAGQLIKSVADTADKLMDLQKKVKDVEKEDPKITNNVTNNAVFVGSTSELQKLLKQGFKDNKSK